MSKRIHTLYIKSLPLSFPCAFLLLLKNYMYAMNPLRHHHLYHFKRSKQLSNSWSSIKVFRAMPNFGRGTGIVVTQALVPLNLISQEKSLTRRKRFPQSSFTAHICFAQSEITFLDVSMDFKHQPSAGPTFTIALPTKMV